MDNLQKEGIIIEILFKKGSVPEIAGCFGGGEKLREAYYELQKELYEI